MRAGRSTTPATLRPGGELGLSADLGRGAPRRAGHRQRRDIDRDHSHRRRVEAHPGRRGRRHAAQPCPLSLRNSSEPWSAFPGRIDLGLGRAPGTDQLTLRALRRTPDAAESFPQDVLELQAFLAPAGPAQRIRAVPAAGTRVPLSILDRARSARCWQPSLACPMRSRPISRPICSFQRWMSVEAASGRPNSLRLPMRSSGRQSLRPPSNW